MMGGFGGPMMGGFGAPMMGGFGGPGGFGFGGGFDPYAPNPYGDSPSEFYDSSFDNTEAGEDPESGGGSGGGTGSSGTTYVGSGGIDNVDKIFRSCRMAL